MKLEKLRSPGLKYALIVGMLASGCRSPVQRFEAWRDSKDIAYYQNFAHRIEYPDVASTMTVNPADLPAPLSTTDPAELPAWELTLQEAVTQALRTGEVLRSLGGSVVQTGSGQGAGSGSAGASVVQTGSGTTTIYEPGLAESNPNGGIEAALSAFDAQVATQLFWQKIDRPVNRPPSAVLDQIFPAVQQQTTGTYTNRLQKTTAFGTQYALSGNIFYDNNNNPTLLFPSTFNGFIQAEMRQPLMQGAGTTFNRIAGPNSPIGQYNGVLVARINMDVSLTQFEGGVINLLNDVESAYWELYYAYRNLDAQVTGRESSLRTWQRIRELQRVGARGGEADAEAQARSQYYLFESRVNDALAGQTGLYAAEQRLRYMMGLPATDGRLIKPLDQPLQAQVSFDWFQALADATNHRVEIRRQKWTIKRRELELLASRLNRRARLDAVTLYRWRGLGDHLIGSRNPNNQFESLAQNITEGNFQEWQAGLEWNYNIGLRQASAAMRNAQLSLVRDTTILKELELRISHDLSNAQRQIDRSFIQVQTAYNRVEADLQQVDVLRNRYERGLININFLLQAQQSLATSQSTYYRNLVDYNLAIRDFHREKGSLLNYNQVQLSEAGYNGKAYADAYEKGRNYTPRDPGATVDVKPGVVTRGAFDPTEVGEVVAPILETTP
jgi:outer membrane protein TolC